MKHWRLNRAPIDHWHSVSSAIEFSERRVAKIVSKVCSIIECKFVIAARCVTSFTGHINSTGPVVENVSRIVTRHCSSASEPSWDAFLELDQYTKRMKLFSESPSFVFWTESLKCLVFLTPVQLVVMQFSLA